MTDDNYVIGKPNERDPLNLSVPFTSASSSLTVFSSTSPSATILSKFFL